MESRYFGEVNKQLLAKYPPPYNHFIEASIYSYLSQKIFPPTLSLNRWEETFSSPSPLDKSPPKTDIIGVKKEFL